MQTNNLKHVGQIINTQRKCVVVFREVPNEEDSCLIVDTDALQDWMHDDIINAVQSAGAQASANFYEYAQRTVLTDGANMLQALHTRGLLRKQKTSNIMMTPNRSAQIRLDELNNIIREQTGGKASVTPPTDQMELAGKQQTKTAPAPTAPAVTAKADGVIDDSALARTMLSQAEQFMAEAARLQEQAYEMDPSLKPTKRGRKKEAAE
jgi:hypothetical protein